MEAGGTVEAKKEGAGNEDLSMEEILQSIRRIIAEDEPEKKPEAKPVEDVPGSDVLELTEMLKEDGGIVNVKEPAKTEASSDVMMKINEALGSKVEPPAEAAAPVAPPPPAAPAAPAAAPAAPSANDIIDSLLSQKAATEAASHFKNLQEAANPPLPDVRVPSAQFRSGTTVEDLVMEMLKPMMKEWLDKNLPAIVERIVEREVRKLTK
jgi:uncharacterized protein